MLNDFQRGKLPFYTLPPGCEDMPQAEAEADQATSASAPTEENEEKVAGDEDETASLTDVGSTCSGLSDISGQYYNRLYYRNSVQGH